MLPECRCPGHIDAMKSFRFSGTGLRRQHFLGGGIGVDQDAVAAIGHDADIKVCQDRFGFAALFDKLVDHRGDFPIFAPAITPVGQPDEKDRQRTVRTASTANPEQRMNRQPVLQPVNRQPVQLINLDESDLISHAMSNIAPFRRFRIDLPRHFRVYSWIFVKIIADAALGQDIFVIVLVRLQLFTGPAHRHINRRTSPKYS